MSHSHQPGSCEHGPEKVDVRLESLTNSAPQEDSLPARILAKSREVAAQSGHKAVYTVGMDVGSTTVKAVVVDAETDQMIWQDYQRHETKQPEKLLEFLKRMQDEVGIAPHNCRIFITGSGGGALANLVGAKFVQEVTAVSLAVEKLHPEVNSVIELGGQDAKIIVFKEDENTGRKKKIPSMNDKCAGGTGAVIDKINAKLKIPADELCDQGYTGIKLHPGRRQVRRVRRDRHQRPAEAGHPARPADGFALRRHRSAESHGPHARPHTASARAAAGRSQQFHSRHEGSVAAEHSAHLGRAQGPAARGREAGRHDQGSGQRAVFRGAGRGRVRQG